MRTCLRTRRGGPGAAAMLLGACLASSVRVLAQAGPDGEPAGAGFIPPLPAGRHGHRAHLLDRQVVVFGGYARGSDKEDRGTRETWILDLPDGKWKRGADMIAGRSFFSSAVAGGAIHAMGGAIERYDAAKDAWETVSGPEVFPASHFGGAALGSKLYALGGFPERSGGFAGFDLEKKTTFDPPEPPGFGKGDHFHVIAALDGVIHVVGGLDGETFEARTDHHVFDGNGWKPAKPPPTGLFSKFAVVETSGDRLYYFSGGTGLAFDVSEDAWIKLASLRQEPVLPASVVWKDRIQVLGGMYVAPTTDRFAYDLLQDRWHTLR